MEGGGRLIGTGATMASTTELVSGGVPGAGA